MLFDFDKKALGLSILKDEKLWFKVRKKHAMKINKCSYI